MATLVGDYRRHVIGRDDITTTHLAICFAIAEHVNYNTGGLKWGADACLLTQEELAKACKCSVRHLSRSLPELVEAGLIEMQRIGQCSYHNRKHIERACGREQGWVYAISDAWQHDTMSDRTPCPIDPPLPDTMSHDTMSDPSTPPDTMSDPPYIETCKSSSSRRSLRDRDSEESPPPSTAAAPDCGGEDYPWDEGTPWVEEALHKAGVPKPRDHKAHEFRAMCSTISASARMVGIVTRERMMSYILHCCARQRDVNGPDPARWRFGWMSSPADQRRFLAEEKRYQVPKAVAPSSWKDKSEEINSLYATKIPAGSGMGRDEWIDALVEWPDVTDHAEVVRRWHEQRDLEIPEGFERKGGAA